MVVFNGQQNLRCLMLDDDQHTVVIDSLFQRVFTCIHQGTLGLLGVLTHGS